MKIIEEKIKEIESKLSVHNLVSTLMQSGKTVVDDEVVASIETILEDAERSLFRLERLRAAMNYLEEELSQVRWLMKKNVH
jgi:hypothetical protein